jgi:hypothetical protein
VSTCLAPLRAPVCESPRNALLSQWRLMDLAVEALGFKGRNARPAATREFTSHFASEKSGSKCKEEAHVGKRQGA